jgi:hypothetical protein
MLGNFTLPAVLQWAKRAELSFTQDGSPPRLVLLFECGLTVILLFGGLGVEDQGLRQVPILLQVIYFCGTEQSRKSTDRNIEHLIK